MKVNLVMYSGECIRADLPCEPRTGDHVVADGRTFIVGRRILRDLGPLECEVRVRGERDN